MIRRPATFLFTDIASSTQRWDEFPDAMRAAFERDGDYFAMKILVPSLSPSES